MTTDQPWTDEQERSRQGYFAAGLTPSLYRYWVGSTTEDLIATRDELAAKDPEQFADIIADLTNEIAYRTPDTEV